jgi:N-acetyl sugar amidotransferase
VSGINWDTRKEEYEEIVFNAKQKKAPFYDALVPVSGGKDSIAQVHRLLKYDLRILAVNVDYGIKTEIGRKNLECISRMGANLVIYRPELSLHTKLIRIGFEDFGDPDLLSHTLLHAYPIHVALRFKIPLVLLGENSAFEYGGCKSIRELNSMTREWFSKYAANNGRDARFISKEYGIPMEKLILYDFPDEFEHSDTKTIFCSFYFYWDSEINLGISKEWGFKTLDGPGEGTYRNYVGIDEKINRIHQYMKVLKFGYGRATDHACEDIRNGRLTREDAKEVVRKYDLVPLSEYYVDDFVEFIGISRERFWEVLEKFRNKEIWQKDTQGNWYIPGHLGD